MGLDERYRLLNELYQWDLIAKHNLMMSNKRLYFCENMKIFFTLESIDLQGLEIKLLNREACEKLIREYKYITRRNAWALVPPNFQQYVACCFLLGCYLQKRYHTCLKKIPHCFWIFQSCIPRLQQMPSFEVASIERGARNGRC